MCVLADESTRFPFDGRQGNFVVFENGKERVITFGGYEERDNNKKIVFFSGDTDNVIMKIERNEAGDWFGNVPARVTLPTGESILCRPYMHPSV